MKRVALGSFIFLFLLCALPGDAQSVPSLAWSNLVDSPVVGVVADSTGAVYVATSTSLAKYNGGSGPAIWNLSSATMGVSPSAIVLDKDGNVFVYGTWTGTGIRSHTFGIVGPEGAAATERISPSGTMNLLDVIAGAKPPYYEHNSIVTDAAGAIYVTGSATCALPTSVAAFQSTCPTGTYRHPFALKIDANGDLVYSTFLNGTNGDGDGFAIAVDSSNNAYVTGTTLAQDFPVTSGALSTTPQFSNGILAKLNPTATKLVYATYLPDTNPSGLAADAAGNAYVTGFSGSHNVYSPPPTMPTTPGVVESAYPADLFSIQYSEPGFVMKVNPTGAALVYSTYLSLPVNYLYRVSPLAMPSLQLDSNGGVYISGQTFRGWALPNSGAASTVNAIQSLPGDQTYPALFGHGDGFVVHLNSDASKYLMGTYFGGAEGDAINTLSLASDGSLYLGGNIVNNEHPLTGTLTMASGVSSTGYVAKIAPAGNGVPVLFANSTSAIAAAPGQLVFGSVAYPATETKTYGFANYGATAFTITSINVTGDFSQTDTCPASMAPGTQCLITVTFKPAAGGTRSGTIQVVTSAAGGLTAGSLSGTGLAAIASPSPATLNFGAQSVGTTSASQNLTITNTGNNPLTVVGTSIQGDFGAINGCGAAIQPGATCQFQVTFTPTASGPRTGSLTINTNAPGSPTVISLNGGVNPDFTLGPPTGATTTQTLIAGQTASYSLALGSTGGFTGTVSFSCSGAPAGGACSVSPSSMNVASASPANVTVSVSTTARNSAALFASRNNILYAGFFAHNSQARWSGLLIATFLLIGFTFVRRQTAVRAFMKPLVMFAIFAVLIFGITGCGGGSSSAVKPPATTGTPAGTYTITVSAVSGSTTHTQNLTLVVQ